MAKDEDRTRDLKRRSMADGGEVVSGSLASEALGAVGARAMTMDHTIFVADDFDPDNPEDQALYAHELTHKDRSGGAGEHGGGDDAEEKAAKAIEWMVLDRRQQGESFSSVMSDVNAGVVSAPDAGSGDTRAPAEPSESSNDPMNAYRAMRRRGMEHEDIVEMLARHVVDALQSAKDEAQLRAPGSSGSM
jgi:hypothetical protein